MRRVACDSAVRRGEASVPAGAAAMAQLTNLSFLFLFLFLFVIRLHMCDSVNIYTMTSRVTHRWKNLVGLSRACPQGRHLSPGKLA